MIAPLTLEQLQQRFGGELANGSVEFDRVCTDTRKLDANAIFVALVGESFDAHDFAADLEGKVLGLVVQRRIEGCTLPQWIVEDTTVALGQIGLAGLAMFLVMRPVMQAFTTVPSGNLGALLQLVVVGGVGLLAYGLTLLALGMPEALSLRTAVRQHFP